MVCKFECRWTCGLCPLTTQMHLHLSDSESETRKNYESDAKGIQVPVYEPYRTKDCTGDRNKEHKPSRKSKFGTKRTQTESVQEPWNNWQLLIKGPFLERLWYLLCLSNMETRSLLPWMPTSRFSLHVLQTFHKHTTKTRKSIKTSQIFASKSIKAFWAENHQNYHGFREA